MAQTLLFDVNETLLDLTALNPLFAAIFGDASARGDWFQRTLMSALTISATGGYEPFDTVAASALGVTGHHYGHPPTPDERARIATAMRELPAHREVPKALERLGAAGYRLVALSNSPGDMLREQLTNAGLLPRFDAVVSAAEARALKPSAAVYRAAAARLASNPDELLMIAAHGWDLAGAARAGLSTGFVERPAHYPEPLFPPPDYRAPDLDALASALIANRHPG